MSSDITDSLQEAIGAWQSFAAAHGLDFEYRDSDWLVQVKGVYCNHSLELYTGKYSTRAVIWVRPYQAVHPPDPLPPILDNPITEPQIVALLAPPEWLYASRQSVKITLDYDNISCAYPQRETEREYLRRLVEALCGLVEHQDRVAQLGGDAIPALQAIAAGEQHPLKVVALAILQTIAVQSQSLRAAGIKPRCPRCLIYFENYELTLPSNLMYYGCPICRHNRTYITGRVITVIDHRMREKIVETGQEIRVNWLRCPHLVDFDGIEIGQASDEEVERFVIQAGNEMTEQRKARYAEMSCSLSLDCRLSENTRRILQHLFGSVEMTSHS